jgi:hypothetical protein
MLIMTSVPFGNTGLYDFIFKDTFLLIIHLKKLVKFINATFTGSVLVPNATLGTSGK